MACIRVYMIRLKYSQTRCMYEVVWWIKALIPGDRCLWYQPACQPVTGKGWYECGWDEIPDNTTPCPIAFASKCLFSAEWQHSNIDKESLGIPHRVDKFHHYCFTKEVYIIIDYKQLVVSVRKDIATLSQWLQHIMLHIHQYSECIHYKPGPDLYNRLAVPSQPHRKQGPGNSRYEHKYMHSKCSGRCSSKHIDRRH